MIHSRLLLFIASSTLLICVLPAGDDDTVSSSTGRLMEVVERDTPGILAFWKIKVLFSDPYKLETELVTQEMASQAKPVHRFYKQLLSLMRRPDTRDEWLECGRRVGLALADARLVLETVVEDDAVESLAEILANLASSQPLLDIDLVQRFERIRLRSPNYQPALARLARLRMAAVGRSCPRLAGPMAELLAAMTVDREVIERDNQLQRERELRRQGEELEDLERAPLISITVICVVSVLLNVVLGYYAALGGAPAKPAPGPSVLYQQAIDAQAA